MTKKTKKVLVEAQVESTVSIETSQVETSVDQKKIARMAKQKEYHAKYIKEHAEKAKEWRKKYEESHKDKIAAYHKEYNRKRREEAKKKKEEQAWIQAQIDKAKGASK